MSGDLVMNDVDAELQGLAYSDIDGLILSIMSYISGALKRKVTFADIRFLLRELARLEVILSSVKNESVLWQRKWTEAMKVKGIVREMESGMESHVDDWISRGGDVNELIRTVMTMDRDIVRDFMLPFSRIMPVNRFLRVDYDAASNTLFTLDLNGIDGSMKRNVANEIDAITGRIIHACKDARIRISVRHTSLKAFTVIQVSPAMSKEIVVSEWGRTSSTKMFENSCDAVGYLLDSYGQ